MTITKPVAGRGRYLSLARVGLALLGFSALVTEVATLVAQHRFAAVNFFSFFTVEANTLAVISLLRSSYAMAAGRSTARLDFFRGAVALYMTTTILVFIVLLSNLPAAELTAVPWDNTVLHYIMPIVIILDWIFAQRTAPIPFRRALLWLLFPLAYLVYSLVRGPIVHWYPYPFMNPDHNGYIPVLVTSIVIAAVLTAIDWVVSTAPRWPHPTLTDPQSITGAAVPAASSTGRDLGFPGRP